MEYLNGGDLFSMLRNLGCLEEDMARVYIAELVSSFLLTHSLDCNADSLWTTLFLSYLVSLLPWQNKLMSTTVWKG